MSSFFNSPDEHGLFGDFGGQYVAETLMPLILELGREYEKAKDDPAFIEELAYFQRDYVGRPSPLPNLIRYFSMQAKLPDRLHHEKRYDCSNRLGKLTCLILLTCHL